MRTDKRFSKKAPSRATKKGIVGFSKKTALLEEAVMQMNAGKYGRASAVLKDLLALDPQNLEARRLFATLHLRLGSLITARAAFESLVMEALQRQDYWLAESLLREYLAAGPRCVPFLELLGYVYEEKGDPMAAVAEYGKAVEVLVEDPDPDRPQRAAELYAKIRQLAPASPIALRLAPMFDARTGELAVMPHVRTPEGAVNGSERQPSSSSVCEGVHQNDALVRLPWEAAEGETKSSVSPERESEGGPGWASQESTPLLEEGTSENESDEGRSASVTFTSEETPAPASERTDLIASAQDVADLSVRADTSCALSAVHTPDAQPTVLACEKSEGDQLSSPVGEATSPPIGSGFSSMPVSEATIPSAAGSDALAAPMPWEQVEATTVAIPRSESESDDSVGQEAKTAPPIDEPVPIPLPHESDAGTGILAELQKPSPPGWGMPLTEDRDAVPSGPAVGESASPVPTVTKTHGEGLLSGPMPWEQVEDTAVSIPPLEPGTIKTNGEASAADPDGCESIIGQIGEEWAAAGAFAIDKIDATEEAVTESQSEATGSKLPETEQEVSPIGVTPPFSLRPEPEADSSAEPLPVRESVIESVADTPQGRLAGHPTGLPIAAAEVEQRVVQQANHVLQEKASTVHEFRLKEKADGGVESMELPPATETALQDLQERQDLDSRQHSDQEGPSANQEDLALLELPVGGAIAVEPRSQDCVFVPGEEPIHFVSAEPTETTPPPSDVATACTPMVPPVVSPAVPHSGIASDTTVVRNQAGSGKSVLSAVDVLFGSAEGRVAATPASMPASLRSRGWLPLALARFCLGGMAVIWRSLATMHSLVKALLMLAVTGMAGLAVGVGLIGLAWIVMEEQPSNAFHNLSSVPEQTGLDPGKNGYLLLLGFDADPSRDPVQTGYERKFTATDLELSKSCRGGVGGTTFAIQRTTSASTLSSWFRTSDPAALFKNQAGWIRTWLSQYETSLDRYRRWLKLPFEDWGYGRLVSPNCPAILAAHRLYIAEGFSESVELGIAQLETDLAAWRTVLAQARTLPIKMMAVDALNDDVAVVSGLLTRLDLEEKFVPRLMKMVRPLDQVEQSLRWPMQSQFVIASKAADPGFKQEYPEDRPFYVSIVAAMPLPKQKRLNAYAEYYEAAMKQGEGPRAFAPELYSYVRTPPRGWLDYLLNPIDNVVGLEPLPPWDLYRNEVLETDARFRLASLQAWIRQSPHGADLLARIAKAGQSVYDPFTGLPMLLSTKKNLLYSVGKDRKDDDGDPRLDVTVLIPHVTPFATTKGHRAAP